MKKKVYMVLLIVFFSAMRINTQHNSTDNSQTRTVYVRVISDVTGQTIHPEKLTLGGKTIQEPFIPGIYELVIFTPGYYKIKEMVKILPGEKPQVLQYQLISRPRSVVLMDTKYGYRIKPYKASINNHPYTPDATFKPGKTYHMKAKFQQYKTVEVTFLIPTGEGTYVIPVDLTPLKQFEITLGEKFLNIMKFDNSQYSLEVFVDGKPVESHHIKKISNEKYIFFSSPTIRVIRLEIGFYYHKSLVNDSFEFNRFYKINAERLKHYLLKLANKKGKKEAQNKFSLLLKNKEDLWRLRQLSLKDKEEIMLILE